MAQRIRRSEMKKIMLVLLAGLLAMSLAACQEKEPAGT